MCLDSDAGQLFLFGGWNGSSELGDLWQFTIASNEWKCLSLDSSQEVSLVFLWNISLACIVYIREDQGQGLVMLCALILNRGYCMCWVVMLMFQPAPSIKKVHL